MSNQATNTAAAAAPAKAKKPSIVDTFLKGCAKGFKVGIENIKGHRTVGGMRASIYNAMPIEGVQALVEYMKEFEKAHS